ncbi:oxaloacetate decarboxylase [Ruegeria sp. HKCCD8929]|uniref:isocitrate lyase/PEP mutase family protein n=1 Tax=Ruegeria sp. HKCCD8929 TaxID=2683006 RepID=UPI00148780C5|nr:isocitrate lyase/PEP mutase family protein [Ruegeria sp. HKCCD8929]
MTTVGARLRTLIEAPEITVLPGVHDTLSALIAQSCGAKAIAAGGYSATASLLGRPDSSQLSLTELGDYYARIAERVEIPMLADGDTGFGNVTNVARTVKVLERAGVGGFFIEDQVFPKRCGHMAGKAIVGVEEMAGKLKAALDARQGDTMIMARTDAIATDGFQEAMDRMALYREIGADILFVEAPIDLDQLRRIPKELDGPCMVNQIDGGATPILSAKEAQDMGYAASAMPVTATHAVMKALQVFYGDLMKNGDLRDAMHHGLGFEAYTDLVGLPQQRATEQAYLDQARAFADGMTR